MLESESLPILSLLPKVLTMNRRFLLLAALLVLFGTFAADGAIQITIDNTDVAARGTGSIELYLVPDVDTNLSAFGFELSIDMPYGTDSLLQFDWPRPAYETDADYVFLGVTSFGPSGDTGILNPSPPPVYLPAPQWFGFDFADDMVSAPLGYVELLGGTPYLLARLNLLHTALDSPYDPVGQTFAVSLVSGANTYFSDEFYGDIPDVTSTSGTVAILGGGAVVPEPSSLLILAGLALCAAPCLRRRVATRRQPS
jgi:hypothetical protein